MDLEDAINVAIANGAIITACDRDGDSLGAITNAEMIDGELVLSVDI